MSAAEASSWDSKNESCQDLIAKHPEYQGWLRQKSKFQQLGSQIEQRLNIGRSKSIVNRIAWPMKYAIVCDGLLYIYADETARKAQKVLRLKDFDRLVEAPDERCKDVLWPFKLEISQEISGIVTVTVYHFSATSADELKGWTKVLENEISKTSPHKIDDRPLPGIPPSASKNGSITTPIRSVPQPLSMIGNDLDDTYAVAEDPTLASAALWNGLPQEASRVMAELTVGGAYLIRRSADNSGYTLVVIIDRKACKFKITENEQTHRLMMMNQLEFDNLSSLVRHYTVNNLPNKSIALTQPYSKFV